MISRRRFLTILGGAAAFPALAPLKANALQWSGIALGAQALIILDHPNADTLIPRALAEISRLENAFSLYRSDSELSRLNRNGSLQNPSHEMVELLSICSRIHQQTLGAFDPTVQSLWVAHARSIAAKKHLTDKQLRAARNLIGWQYVRNSPREIHFEKQGMALTLNGIAQGFIADKVAALLRTEGVQNTLVNTGEISAVGAAPNAATWQIQAQGQTLHLSDMAIATSAPLGTVLDAAETLGHIFDPRIGAVSKSHQAVTVIHKSAAIADGLSTGFSLLSRAEIDAQKGRARVIIS